MKKLALNQGRVRQKLSTRAAILEAAKSLMEKKGEISLEEIAIQANISRATIYRYFPKLELLLVEASLDVHFKSPDELAAQVKTKPLAEKIFFIQNYYNKLAEEHELLFRRYLSSALNVSITSKKKIRGARRVATLEKALSPFKKELSHKVCENLKNICSILMGIDALVVSKDVCGLNNQQSRAVLQWGIQMILKGISSEKS